MVTLILPLFALAALAFVPAPAALDLPWLLLGTRLVLDETGLIFLGFTSLVWLMAALYARTYLRDDPRKAGFTAFFVATQAGNLGVCVAGDAASFYFFFALMTFAAYGLVIHSGKPEARRAANVYLAMAILGETLLVVGMMMASHAADSLLLADIVRTPLPLAAVLLLLAGFGVKVGVPLLHMWLPLAHPVAPVPASAVLSGVMLKAGLLGWLRFLPLGQQAWPEVGVLVMTLGVLAMFMGVVFGFGQRDAKVVLAYSSISQMGFMTLGVGAGLYAPSLWPGLLPAVMLYALHHALAKSALFLGVGVALAYGRQPWVIIGLALPALALAGLPGTSGFLAKSALKAALDVPAPWSTLFAGVLPLAALGTTALMVRLLWLLGRGDAPAHPVRGLATPWLALVSLGLALPWGFVLLGMSEGGEERGATLLAASWPVLLGGGLAWFVIRRGGRVWAPPPGDGLTLIEKLPFMTAGASKGQKTTT